MKIMMKKIINDIVHRVLLFLIIVCNTAYAMDGFHQPQAEALLDNYHHLHEYLMRFVGQQTKSFVWHGKNITANKEVFQWIEQTAEKTGNIVCLYMAFRNYLTCCNVTACSQSSYEIKKYHKKMFTLMMLLLMRTTYDIIYHYSIFHDSSIFNAYHVMKYKIKHLINQHAPTLTFENYPYFRTTITKALTYWLDCFGVYQSSSHRSWLRSFGWAHGWTPGSYALYFGPNNDQDMQKLRETNVEGFPTLSLADVFPLVSEIFTNISLYESWDDFFGSFDFPITENQLENRIKNNLQDKFDSIKNGFTTHLS